MYARHRLDLGLGDVAYGVLACGWVRSRTAAEAEVLSLCGRTGQALVSLSVRSGWDLLLTATDWPTGSEVLVSGLTHPDMVELLARHGLTPVPVDLDLDTLAPTVEAWAAAVTTRTRALLVAHLFGGRVDVAPLAALASRHGLLLVEDCAQAFAGPDRVGGEPAAVSLYSFGMIKTCSAVGGAVVVVADPALLAAMTRIQAGWPAQRRRDYVARLITAAALLVVSRPGPYGAIVALCRWTGRDLDGLVSRLTRSFVPDPVDPDALLRRLRRRPAAPLVRLLARRLRRWDPSRLRRRAVAAETFVRQLPALVLSPGGRLPDRTHWLVPVVVTDPGRLVVTLQREGFDASRATSNLVAVKGPGPDGATAVSRMLSGIVFLPVRAELRPVDRHRLLSLLRASVGSASPEAHLVSRPGGPDSAAPRRDPVSRLRWRDTGRGSGEAAGEEQP